MIFFVLYDLPTTSSNATASQTSSGKASKHQSTTNSRKVPKGLEHLCTWSTLNTKCVKEVSIVSDNNEDTGGISDCDKHYGEKRQHAKESPIKGK